ncbi:MAG: hypothetical protein ABI920_14530 [Casimicrobiaceae bacterium]
MTKKVCDVLPVWRWGGLVSAFVLTHDDLARYGSAVERKRRLERWDREVGSQPR